LRIAGETGPDPAPKGKGVPAVLRAEALRSKDRDPEGTLERAHVARRWSKPGANPVNLSGNPNRVPTL